MRGDKGQKAKVKGYALSKVEVSKGKRQRSKGKGYALSEVEVSKAEGQKLKAMH